MPRKILRRIQIATAFFAVLLLVALGAIWGQRQDEDTTPPISPQLSKLGGAFSLVNMSGERVTEKDFAGRYMLIYFGFTFCPDICPMSLTVMANALNILRAEAPDKAARIAPIFVTIDPARDTPAALAEYVPNFGPEFIGLTGNPAEIAQMAGAYRVYYRKVIEDGASDYVMDHSSIYYLMGPDGRYAAHFDHRATAETLAARLAAIVATH